MSHEHSLFYWVKDFEADDPEVLLKSPKHLGADELRRCYKWLPEFIFAYDFHKLQVEFGLRQITIEIDRGPVVIDEQPRMTGETGDIQ
jgi:hypothetical protein